MANPLLAHHHSTPSKSIKPQERHYQLRRYLTIVFYGWSALLCLLLAIIITEPEVIDMGSPGLANNKIIRQADKLVVAERVIPGIDNYKGDPNFAKNIDDYDYYLAKAAKKYDINCTLLKAHMFAESQGKPRVISPSGAIGLMQLMPATARAIGYPGNLRDPLTNIMAGAKYLKHLEQTACYEKPMNEVCDTSRDIKYQMAAYNGGSKCNKPAYSQYCAQQTMWECQYFDVYSQTRINTNRVKANYHHLKNNHWGC
jgi:membrane-bound lytic murein transglycosylase MltF